ncbi:hypothetical protein KIN20_029108 [Parelaphostrongylus tenuis]|uniref:Uncharacterized protein n=1 Tax=Parelaphostrongylus tenuis TaxID=148309 RepID=A0AAD5R1S9_PARTN|nr:hypothetical protein KIN20_029108 [Parelaphostrongylus tenuis]
MNTYSYPFHDQFFIFGIVMGSTLLLLNLQMMLVIRQSKSLWILSVYRLIFFGSAADVVNCGAQIAALAVTLRTPAIDPRTNFTAIFLCCFFGAVNSAFCLSGELNMLWNPSVPTFYFTNESSFIAILARSTSFYFGEVVYSASFVVYLIIVLFLLSNRQLISSVPVELPLLPHSVQVFAFSTILLYLWFYPLSDSGHCNHIVNTLVLFRFGATPISLYMTNRTYRGQLSDCKRKFLGTTTVAVQSQVTNRLNSIRNPGQTS